MLREGFVGENSRRRLTCTEARAEAAQGRMQVQLVCLCECGGGVVVAGGLKPYIQELLERRRRRGGFYHACLVFRSSSHGLTERQVLKAADWGKKHGSHVPALFLLRQRGSYSETASVYLLDKAGVSLELDFFLLCDGFVAASQNTDFCGLTLRWIKEVVWTYAGGQGAKREGVGWLNHSGVRNAGVRLWRSTAIWLS